MNSNVLDIIKLTISTIVIAIGWVVANYFTLKRDRESKRRDITLEHLIKTYRTLEHEIVHRELNDDTHQKLELVITDIQLFGLEEQIILAKKLANDIAKKDEFWLDDLINSLRDDLRQQLGLKKIEGNVTWLRKNMPKKKLN